MADCLEPESDGGFHSPPHHAGTTELKLAKRNLTVVKKKKKASRFWSNVPNNQTHRLPVLSVSVQHVPSCFRPSSPPHLHKHRSKEEAWQEVPFPPGSARTFFFYQCKWGRHDEMRPAGRRCWGSTQPDCAKSSNHEAIAGKHGADSSYGDPEGTN